MPFDPSILRPDARREEIVSVLQAALDAVDPFKAVRKALHRDGNTLTVGGRRYDLARYRRVLVIGAGKAGAPMAQAVEDVLDDVLSDGLVVVKGDPTGLEPSGARLSDVVEQGGQSNHQATRGLRGHDNGVGQNVLVTMNRVLLEPQGRQLGEMLVGPPGVDEMPETLGRVVSLEDLRQDLVSLGL